MIFIIRDVASVQRDERIARHILARHTNRGFSNRNVIDPDMLTKYFAYAKRFKPEMTSEAEEVILKYYLEMRKGETSETINATPRQLEGIIRLSTARARLLMKDTVEAEDAERAIHLLNSSLAEAGYDREAGRVDLMVLHGKGSTQLNKLQLFMDILRSLEGDKKIPVSEEDLLGELVKTDKFDIGGAREYLKKIMQEGSIYEPKPGHYNTL